MEFTLLYSGTLMGASKNDTRASHKHEIRRIFHPQLRRLWNSHHGLLDSSERIGMCYPFPQATGNGDLSEYENRSPGERRTAGLNRIAFTFERNGYGFVPLVTEEKFLRCSLDILLLRPGEPKLIRNSGDLDAKVKTVFDALKMPASLDECGGIGPQEDETPFFCLLQDDKLISEIKVSSDELLALPLTREPKPNDAFLVIRVKLLPVQRTLYSYIFE